MFVSVAWLLSGAALAQGGALVGVIGEDTPQSAGTLVSIGRDGSGFTLVISAALSSAASDVALLWPAEGIVPGLSTAVDPRWMMRVEASTRPRQETLTCDEMLETLHWRTPPGCASYEVTVEEEPRGEDAAASAGVAPIFSAAAVEIELLQPADVETWLSARGLLLDEAMAAALQPHRDRGELVLAVHPLSPVQQGQWLPPVQLRIEPPGVDLAEAASASVVLPLAFGSVSSILRHELYLFGVAPDGAPDPVIENYPQELLSRDCMLPEGRTLEQWLSSERSAVEERAALPTWVIEHTGRADRCSPCTDAPLEPYTLGQLGLEAEPTEARLSRIWMSADPMGFDEDIIVSFPPASDLPERSTRVYTSSDALEFALPVCGSGYAPDPGVCDGIHPPGSRCGTALPSLPALPLLSAVILAALLRARRSRAGRLPLALLLPLLSASPEASAASRDLRPDLAPRTEVFAGMSVLGTDRVVPSGLSRGAPWLGNPYVGLSVRQSLYSWRGGRSVGLLAEVRGLHGRAAPFSDQGLVSFTLIEPVLSFDVRHGRFREQSPCSHLRYGAGLALPALVPSSSRGRIVPSGALHVGYGWWIGRGLSRHDLEISLGIVPRTDGFETRYHPSAAIPGFLWYPGTANLWISFGRAFYGPTSRKHAEEQ